MFIDTEEERNTLIQQIPSIRAYASQLGLSFLLSEMRWGVTETLSASHKTTELCLQQLQECQTTSPILNFVVGYAASPLSAVFLSFSLAKISLSLFSLSLALTFLSLSLPLFVSISVSLSLCFSFSHTFTLF